MGSRQVTLAEGMAMSGLHNSEVFWDKTSDVKMLMAWNQSLLICAFRGTDSWANARFDIQVSQASHYVAQHHDCTGVSPGTAPIGNHWSSCDMGPPCCSMMPLMSSIANGT